MSSEKLKIVDIPRLHSKADPWPELIVEVQKAHQSGARAIRADISWMMPEGAVSQDLIKDKVRLLTGSIRRHIDPDKKVLRSRRDPDQPMIVYFWLVKLKKEEFGL